MGRAVVVLVLVLWALGLVMGAMKTKPRQFAPLPRVPKSNPKAKLGRMAVVGHKGFPKRAEQSTRPGGMSLDECTALWANMSSVLNPKCIHAPGLAPLPPKTHPLEVVIALVDEHQVSRPVLCLPGRVSRGLPDHIYRLPTGYFFTNVRRGMIIYLHRFVCFWMHGPPPDKEMEASHLCGYPDCLNPYHIQWMSREENEGVKEYHKVEKKKGRTVQGMGMPQNLKVRRGRVEEEEGEEQG